MRELADKKLQITLALSLHASTQEKRLELMPVANKYEIHEVIDACRYYFEQTGRRITFEYSLVGGKNDSEEDAQRLAELIEQCRKENVGVIFIQEEFDRKNAELIARETRTQLVSINPLAYDYDKELRQIAKILSKQ